MSDDDVVLLEDGMTTPHNDAIYNGRCKKCYDPDVDGYNSTGHIDFIFDGDPDSPCYHGECSDCGDGYSLWMSTVAVSHYPDE